MIFNPTIILIFLFLLVLDTAHGQVSATVKPNNVREFTLPWNREKYNRKPRLPVSLRRLTEKPAGQGLGVPRQVPKVKGIRAFWMPKKQKVTTAAPGDVKAAADREEAYENLTSNSEFVIPKDKVKERSKSYNVLTLYSQNPDSYRGKKMLRPHIT